MSTIVLTWRRCPYVPFLDLRLAQQMEARRAFSPARRWDGWQYIQRWAFAVTSAGHLARHAPIEPLGGDDLARAATAIAMRTWDLANGRIGPHEPIV